MSTEKLTGAQQANFHYYLVEVPQPAMAGLPPYVAECQDIIAALNLTFAEGEALKALWRAARLRQGFGKPGASLDYDFDKVAHYGARSALENKQKAEHVPGELFAKIYNNPSKE
jgi:hypothetical protein